MAGDGAKRRALVATAGAMAIDQQAAAIVENLRSDGFRAILLKGASIARRLYRDGGPRPYVDIDLLVSPDQFAGAGQVLTRLGYRLSPRGSFLEWRREHEGPGDDLSASEGIRWDNPGSPPVDLHRTIQGVGSSPQRCWAVLSARTEELVVGGSALEVLASPPLGLHVALHAVTSCASAKAVRDLERALEELTPAEWEEACGLARELEAVPAFGMGMRLLPRGGEVADALRVPRAESVELRLKLAGESLQGLPFERMLAARGIREKLGIVLRAIFPRPAFVRAWVPQEGGPEAGLVAGYLYRLAWVGRRLPTAVRAWLGASRAAVDPAKASKGS